jgi:hypothetical protein
MRGARRGKQALTLAREETADLKTEVARLIEHIDMLSDHLASVLLESHYMKEYRKTLFRLATQPLPVGETMRCAREVLDLCEPDLLG